MPLAFQPILRGILYSIIIAFILIGVVGLVTNLTNLPESSLIENGIFSISVFFGGLTAARMAGTKGLYYGAAVGMGMILVILLFLAIMEPRIDWLVIAERALYALVAGGIGGIVGVALKQ
jgi:putative membrane protein (TIGR04086 family)